MITETSSFTMFYKFYNCFKGNKIWQNLILSGISAPDLMHSEDILLPHGGPHQRRRRLGCPAHHQEGPVGGGGGGHMGGQLGFAPQATSKENWA